MYTSTITTCIYTRCMYTDEEMAGKRVKSDTDGETGETKQDKDRTHTDEENSENWRIIAGRGQHSLSIYIFKQSLRKDGLYTWRFGR